MDMLWCVLLLLFFGGIIWLLVLDEAERRRERLEYRRTIRHLPEHEQRQLWDIYRENHE